MSSLRFKIIISTLSIIILIVMGSYLVIQDIQKGIIQGEFRNKGFLLANHLAMEVTMPLLVNDLVEIRKSVENIKNSNPDIEYVFVTDSEGIVVMHTFEGVFPEALQKRIKTIDIPKEYIFENENGIIIHEFDAVLFENIGYVHIGLSETEVRARIFSAAQKLLSLAISAAVLGGVFIYFIGRRLTEPIKKLTDGANRINKGNLGHKIDIASRDELGELAQTFNDMAFSLDQKMKDLVASKEEIILRNKELTALNEIAKNISATFDLNKILVKSLENLLKLANMESGEVYLPDEKSGRFVPAVRAGGNETVVSTPEDINDVLIAQGTDVCFVHIPVKSKDKILGIITIRSKEPHKFSNRDRELFMAIGNQIGVAIENIEFLNNINYLKEFNEEILNNVNLGIHVVDNGMKILAINNEFLNLGRGRFKKEQIINKNLYEVFPVLKEKYVDKEYEYVLKTGEIFPSEEKTEYDGETIYTSTSKIPIKGKSGNVEKIITVIKDVSDQKKLEEELKDSYEELRLTYLKLKELYQIKDNFLSNMSHELRTPLTSVIGYTELLLESNITSEQRHKLEIIFRNSQRLHKLIEGLLDTAVIEARNLKLDRQIVSVHDLAVRAAEDVKSTASGKNLPINIEVPALLIEGDRERLAQVFSNVVENAVKFTLAGEIKIAAGEENEYVHVKISDTGIGIPEDKLELIFDRFYLMESSKTRKYGGTGLSLWISRNIVEAHGGKIWAESKNRGSTFHILLPKKRRGNEQ